MNAKFLLLGSLLGAITMFFWGFVSHTIIPWEENIVHEFKDGQAIVEQVKKSAPQNGIYLDKYGVFAAVSFRPDFGEKYQSIGANLGLEFACNAAVCFLLCLVIGGLRSESIGARAFLASLAGMAAGIDLVGSYANWYGFSTIFALAEIAIITVGWFLAGLVIGLVQRKTAPGIGK